MVIYGPLDRRGKRSSEFVPNVGSRFDRPIRARSHARHDAANGGADDSALKIWSMSLNVL